MRQPFISFVIPVYNAEKYIGQCIESVLSQKFQDWELILVDDGSFDKSCEICDTFSQNDLRIKVIHRTNGGQGSARNVGAREASGKWLMFIDDDDWLDKETCTECIPYLTDDIDFLIFGKREVYRYATKESTLDIDESVIEFTAHKEMEAFQINILNRYAPHEYSYPLYKIPFWVPWAKFFRMSFWRENDISFVEGANEDCPCLLKVWGCAKKVKYLNSCFYNYRIYESSCRMYMENAIQKYHLAYSTIHEYIQLNYPNEKIFHDALQHFDITTFSYATVLDYCHRKNPQSYFIRKKRFQQAFQAGNYKNAFEQADLSCLPLRKKIVAILIRHGNFFILNTACRMNDIWNYFTFNNG